MIETISKTCRQESCKFDQPEIELLLACSRTQLAPRLKTRIKFLVQQNIDWQHFVQLAAQHQVTSLIYHNLATTCSDAIPLNIKTYLHQQFQINAQRNLFTTSELIKIYKLFQVNNIFVIPFKGTTLATIAYKNLAFRSSCDIDLLIDKKNILLATKLLKSLGYEVTKSAATVKNNPDLRYGPFLQSEPNQKGYDFINRDKIIAIDLQWSLTTKAQHHYFSLDFEQIQKKLAEVSLAGIKLPQFAPETMLLFLCFHGSKHCWQSLKWVCDLAEFIGAHPKLDWQAIEVQAHEMKLTTMLHLSMFLVNDLYGTKIPENLSLAMSKKTRAYSLFKQVRALIFTRRFTQWEDYIFMFNITDSWLGKSKFLSSLIFTPTMKEFHFITLPKYLFPLYYVIRPYRLFSSYFMSNASQKE